MDKKESQNGFPSPFRNDISSPEFGKEFGKGVWKDSLKGDYGVFDAQRDRVVRNRKYAAGLEDKTKFKTQLTSTGDLTYLTLNWDVETPLPNVRNIFHGKLINMPYEAKPVPVDQNSRTLVDRERRRIKAQMAFRDTGLAKMVEENTGKRKIEENLPEDAEELEILFSTTYKSSRSIGMTYALNHVHQANNHEEVKKQVAADFVDAAKGGYRLYLDKDNNIHYRPVDPARLITSYCEKYDFSDAKYIGEVVFYTVSQLRSSFPSLGEDMLYQIAKSSAGLHGNGAWMFENKYYSSNLNSSRYDDFRVMALDFEAKLNEPVKFQKSQAKNNGFYFQKRPSSYVQKPNSKKQMIGLSPEVVYQGIYIPSCDEIIKWEKKNWLVRNRIDGVYSSKANYGFIIYGIDMREMNNKSITERMIGHADQMILAQLKIQHFMSKAAPPGYVLDIDAFTAAMNGMGMSDMRPIDAEAIVQQTGNIYVKSMSETGRPLVGSTSSPVTPKPSTLDFNGLKTLIEIYNFHAVEMKNVVGLPPAADTITPDSKALVGIQKNSLLAHSDSFRGLKSGFLDVERRLNEQLCLHIQDLINYDSKQKKVFERAIGMANVKQIDATELTNADFAIYIHMLPEDEDIARISKYLEIALQTDKIGPDDAIMVERVAKESTDKAELVLSYKSKKYLKRKQEETQAAIQANTQSQVQAAQAAAEAKAMEYKAKAEAEAMVKQVDIAGNIKLEDKKHEHKMAQITLENEFKIEQIKVATDKDETSTSSGKNDLRSTSIKAHGIVKEPPVLPTPPTAQP